MAKNEGGNQGGPEPHITVIVNGRPKHLNSTTLTFLQVVALAFDPVRTDPDVLYTVQYSRGPRENPEGELVEGGMVHIKSGMVFLVTETNRS